MNQFIRLTLALWLLLAGNTLLAFQDSESVNEEEEVYLSFRYQGAIDAIVIALATDDDFYLPVTELFELFAVNYTLTPSNFSISGYYLFESNTYVLDFANFRATINGKEFNLNASDFIVKDVDFYVKPQLLEQIFDLRMTIDLSRLVLKLDTQKTLPIISRLTNRKSQQTRMRYTQVSDEWFPLLVNRNPRVANGAILDYTLYTSVSENNRVVNLNSNFGGELLFGDVQGRLTTSSNTLGTQTELSGFRWRYVEDRSPWFTRLNIGSINSRGLTSQTFKGVSVSNEPIVTRRSFDQYVIDGHTEADAEVELYSDNRLVEVSKSDESGYYRFFVPLSYGVSRFKTRIYAKQGHIIEQDRQIDVPFTFLPPGEFRYQINAGTQSTTDSIYQVDQNLGLATLAYGVNNWLSVKGGIDYSSEGNSGNPFLYNQISSRVGSAFLMNMDMVYGAYYRMTASGYGPETSSWNVNYTYYEKQGELNSLGYDQQFNTGLFFPLPMGVSPMIVRFEGSWYQKGTENSYRTNLFLNHTYRGFRLQYGFKDEHRFTSLFHTIVSTAHFGAVYSIPRNPIYHPLFQGVYLRGDLFYNTSLGEFDSFSMQFSKQINKNIRLQVSLNDQIRDQNTMIEIGFVWDAEKLRSATSFNNSQGLSSASQTFRGSMALDRSNGAFLWDNRQQVGRSGASIRMFVDENNSGLYDSGETILPGNAISIKRATSRVITHDGVARLTQLQPYRRYNFEVNEAKITDPMLVPLKKEFSVVLDPNSYKILDVPFFTTGIIDGRVDKIVDDQFIPLSGLKIHMKIEDEDTETILRTFSDGSFYSMEVPPGDYELWVDETQLEFLGMNALPEKLFFTVESSAEGDFIENLNFILQ